MPPAEPQAGGAGRKKLLVLVIVAILVVAGLGAVAYILLAGTSPPPPPPAVTLNRVTVTSQGGKTAIDQGEPLTLSAVAIDTEATHRTSAATFVWSATPAGRVQIRASAVTSTVQVFGINPGAVTVTANATWNNSARENTLSLTVNPISFEVTASTAFPLVGTPFTVTVRAVRADTTTSTGYRGVVHFTSDDSGASLPSDYNFTVGDSGTHAFAGGASLSRAGAVKIDAADTIAAVAGNVTVTGNRAPIASFTATVNGTDPIAVDVSGTASSDPDGNPFSWTWDFGDSTPAVFTPTATHAYAAGGTYTVQLRVQDSHGASDVASASFRARARPTASFFVRSWAVVGPDLEVTLNAAASGDADGWIQSYNWTWGDGNYTQNNQTVTTHVYNASFIGSQVTIRLRVTDNDLLQANASLLVTVTNPVPPDVRFTVTRVDQLTRTVEVDASLTDDVNGDLAYLNWTWGDGTYTNGTAAANAIASHTYATDGPGPLNEYVINLTAEDYTNLKNWTEQNVQILQPIVGPTAMFNATRTLMSVAVDANASFDYNGDIATYAWDWGDGNTAAPSAAPYAAHTYAVAGAYVITLTVEDSRGARSTYTRRVSVAASTIDYDYYDFFNVPYGEWWDYRFATYGDLPINANCFNASSIADGVCIIGNPSIRPYEDAPPYTNWYPLPGALNWNANANNPMVYAGYRFRVAGVNVPGYNRSEPVFLPTLNYAQPAGTKLDFNWRMQYLDKATGDALTNDPVDPCPSVDPAAYDGFYIRSQVQLTMDLQQSRRMFNVVGADATAARAWWAANTRPECALMGSAETNVKNWFLAMGGGGSGSAGVGKYDIANSFEWYYTNYFLDMEAFVDDDGTTYVTIDHAAWGTEVMLSRMFYWGNTSYKVNYLDSTKAAGWWGMELGWFEDFDFAGSLGAPGGGFNFNLTTAMQYHFQQLASPGPNGLYDRTDDVPYWTWGPILSDYTNDYFAQHPASELDRYPTAEYVHSTPGGTTYGELGAYDYAPIRWDLLAGQTQHFEFPKGNVVYYDPNLTPKPANPQGDFVEVYSTMKYDGTNPVNYGYWDDSNKTWDVYGPTSTGGPEGSPGPDGIPGTADDRYALEPFGAIRLVDPPVTSSFVLALSRSDAVAPSLDGLPSPSPVAGFLDYARIASGTPVARLEPSRIRSRE